MLRRLDTYAENEKSSRSGVVCKGLEALLGVDQDAKNGFDRLEFRKVLLVGIGAIIGATRSRGLPDIMKWPRVRDDLIVPNCVDPGNPDWRSMIPDDILVCIDSYIVNLEHEYDSLSLDEFKQYIEIARSRLLNLNSE